MTTEKTEKINGNGKESSQKKFLFVSEKALIGDLAWQVKQEGHQVKYYIHDKDSKDICDGFVEKAEEWTALKDWADVIVFDDVFFGEIADKLRKEGKAVIGGSVYTDKLEEDREFGQEELKKVGVNVLPHWDFTDFDEAIQFVSKNPGRYVLKPTSKGGEKELLYVGQEEDGKDVIQLLEHYKRAWSKKIKFFQLQKYAAGVEIAVGAFFNCADFITPINVNFEHKKMFPGDIGPSTGEMGCYDETTEVLTKTGWKLFKEVTYADEFATLHPETNKLEYYRPSNIVQYTHHKKLVHIKNRATDLLVTLDHNLFGQEANAYRKQQLWGFVKAKNLPYQFVAPRTATWVGEERQFFTIPAQPFFHYEGIAVRQKTLPPMHILMDDWLAFIGFWLAEGSTSSSSYTVTITQVTPKKKVIAQKIISKMPFKFKQTKTGWDCHNKQLWSYLRPFGNALTKYVAQEYKELCLRQLSILFDNMCHGDGNLQKNGFRIYYTSSKKLADDVQEILLKLGRVGIIKQRLRTTGKIGNRVFKEIHQSYEVIERIKKTVAWIDVRDSHVVDYQGTVYCVTVPYHTLYVRRNGKPLWCGNTLAYWSPPNTIFHETLEKIKPALAQCGYVGYIDINCIVNARGIYPLEFTSRFGYPTISLHIEGVTSQWGEFLYSLATKKPFEFKTKKGFQICVVIAVPPFPFYDIAAFKKYSEDATILFKKPATEGVHLGDVKLVEGDWRLAGYSGYALVITGSGQTVDEARKQAYSRVKNIMIPNMFYRTDIGFRWLVDSDKLHTWGFLY